MKKQNLILLSLQLLYPMHAFICLRSIFVFLLLIGSVGPFSLYGAPDTLYVDGSTSAQTQNGQSWQTPYKGLHTALSNARSGQHVWVKKGAYRPANANGLATQTATFELPNGVKLYGGFAGNERTLDAREKGAKTLLTGDIGTPITTLGKMNDKGYHDNCYHVLTIPSSVTSGVVDGFIIEAGYARTSAPHNSGAGVLALGSAQLQDLVIRYNQSEAAAGVLLSAGMLINAHLHDNKADHGGGIALSGGTIVNALLHDNLAGMKGGGIYLTEGKLINATLHANSADTGGGIYIAPKASANAMVANTVLYLNTAAGAGKGWEIYNEVTAGTGIQLSHVLLKEGDKSIEGAKSHVVRKEQVINANNQSPFVSMDPKDDNYLLPHGSSALVDAGKSAHLPDDITQDLGYQKRIQDASIDIGTYEVKKILLGTPTPRNLRVYPNPVSHTLHFESNTYSIRSATLFSLSGAVVRHVSTRALNVSALAPGGYILAIYHGDEVVRHLILKQ